MIIAVCLVACEASPQAIEVVQFLSREFAMCYLTLPEGIGLYTSLPSRAAGGSDVVAAGEGDALKLDIV